MHYVSHGRPLPRSGAYIKCPLCSEVVRSDVRICRYCKADIAAENAPQQLTQGT